MKDRQKGLRRSLWVSALAIVLCCAMLVGTTFAWFTDSVSSSGNRIEAGTFDITATVAEVDADEENYTIEGINGGKAFGFGEAADLEAEGTGPIISEELWEPGKTSAKLLTVTNNGSLAAKLKISFAVTDDGLQDALWYDFMMVEDGNVKGEFTKKPMNTLVQEAGALELPVLSGESASFILVYGMDELAGNEYQGRSFEATVNILAAQHTYEKDGFGGDQYDKGAGYPVVVATEEELQNALNGVADGGVIKLQESVAVSEPLTVTDKKVTVILDGNTLSTEGAKYILQATEDAKVTVSGGVLHSDNAKGAIVFAENQANVTLDGCTLQTGEGMYYAATTNGSNSKGVRMTFRNCTLLNPKGYTCYFPAGEIVMENYDVTGAVIISGGKVTIDGGTYTADGFAGQSKIWGEADTAGYMAKFYNRDGCGHMGDSILLMDRRAAGYGTVDVTIRNAAFHTELTFPDGSTATAYAVKYVDYNNMSGAFRGTVTLENNTYIHKLSGGQNPLMAIQITDFTQKTYETISGLW